MVDSSNLSSIPFCSDILQRYTFDNQRLYRKGCASRLPAVDIQQLQWYGGGTLGQHIIVESAPVDPFKRGSKITRTPGNSPLMGRPYRAKSSRPHYNKKVRLLLLWKNCILVGISRQRGNINKLVSLMSLPPRSINKSRRKLLSAISRLHTRAKEQIFNSKKTDLAFTLTQAAAEAREKQNNRKTPPLEWSRPAKKEKRLALPAVVINEKRR